MRAAAWDATYTVPVASSTTMALTAVPALAEHTWDRVAPSYLYTLPVVSSATHTRFRVSSTVRFRGLIPACVIVPTCAWLHTAGDSAVISRIAGRIRSI